MKTTLDKLVNKIKDFTFYRIAFDTYDEKRVWIIGEKKSYLKKIVDSDGPYYRVYLNARQTISISIDDKDEVWIKIWPDLDKQIDVSCEEEDNYFYRFDSEEEVIDFEGFDTPDKFFKDILRVLDDILKDKYNISIDDLSSGQYFESRFGEEDGHIHGALYELAAYKLDMTGIEISCLIQEPISDYGFVCFKKLSNIKGPHKSVTTSCPVTDPKNKLLNIIKKAATTSTSKSRSWEREINKCGKWLSAKMK